MDSLLDNVLLPQTLENCGIQIRDISNTREIHKYFEC